MASCCADQVLSRRTEDEVVVLSCRTPMLHGDKPFSTRLSLLTEDNLRRDACSMQAVEKWDGIVLVGAKAHSKHVGDSQRTSVTIVESEVLASDSENESDSISISSTLLNDAPYPDTIGQSFRSSQSRWIDDPVISEWRKSRHSIHRTISAVETLYRDWKESEITSLNPHTDRIWLQVGRVLANVGLPWHNNQINMPDEIDTSWPFHFKSFEAQVIKAKGVRVGEPNPSGYVCNWSEANCYGIRALQQELRQRYPSEKPLLVYDQIDQELVWSAERLFGLESYQVDLSQNRATLTEDLKVVTTNGSRPIIFTATLANKTGRFDNLRSICDLAKAFALILHVDASRNFDYVTTMTDTDRQRLGIEKLVLGMPKFYQSQRSDNGSILASTIVAGGSNYTNPAPVVALKPLALGSAQSRVAYTRASDSTLAGSRDAIAPLWVGLQEMRFGKSGFNRVFQYCASMRKYLVQALSSLGVHFSAPVYSLDIIIEGLSTLLSQKLIDLGGVAIAGHSVLLTIQPSIKSRDIKAVLEVFSPKTPYQAECLMPLEQDFADTFPIPKSIVNELESTVNLWKVATRSAAGYPFHMGSYSALGPIIGAFLDLKIPHEWTQARENELVDTRLKSFGLVDSYDRTHFKGAFTNGSTMGNRVGIHTALAHFPDAFLYFSSETHYSVRKTARDCDTLTNRWSQRSCRFSEISCNGDGSISVDKLLQQALLDQEECRRHGEQFQVILFLNMGTTFVGARDDIQGIRDCLHRAGITISYIHLDGALDFGFHNHGIVLGPPGLAESEGRPVVQGVTLSHHKAMGNMVSGEVLCYSPGSQLAALGSDVDPRAVFETWLYAQVYSDEDWTTLHSYCQDNASRLEKKLNAVGVVTKRNRDSTIVVLERPPAWIIEEFSLRPEEDWVHFITMPHISSNTVDLFVDRIAWVDRQCERAFQYVMPSLSSILQLPLKFKRVQSRSNSAGSVTEMAKSLTSPTVKSSETVNLVVKSSLRGAMSVVVVDEEDEPLVVFLAESTRRKSIRAGPIIAKSEFCGSREMLVDIGRQLVGFMARHLDAQLEIDDMSYVFLLTG